MYTWIFATGVIFAFYNAWGGGANDCANSFATLAIDAVAELSTSATAWENMKTARKIV